MRSARALLVGCVLASIAGLSATAWAEGTSACRVAFSRGPERVKQGQLVAGREDLQLCASAACPAAMNGLCAGDLRSLEGRIPSVVLAATDPGGRDLSDVRVSEGGRPLVAALDGRALEMDPGPHRFRFERAGSAPVETTVVVREGEKDRVLTVTLAPATASVPPPLPPHPGYLGDAPRAAQTSRPIPWTVYAAGGLTVATAGFFAYFGLHGLAQRADLGPCKGYCDQGLVDTATRNLNVADGFLAATIVGVAGTTLLFLTRPRASAVAVSPGLGSLSVSGVF